MTDVVSVSWNKQLFHPTFSRPSTGNNGNHEFLNLRCPVAQDQIFFKLIWKIYPGVWQPVVFSNMKPKGLFYIRSTQLFISTKKNIYFFETSYMFRHSTKAIVRLSHCKNINTPTCSSHVFSIQINYCWRWSVTTVRVW